MRNNVKMNLKVALCQMHVIDNKKKNLINAKKMIKEASSENVDLIILPEMFNCPYNNEKFIEYAENKNNSETLIFISNLAKKYKVDIVAGSIPEEENQKIYNTSFVFNKKGKIVGSHRKMHLFDINVPNKIKFIESDTLSPGNEFNVINMDYYNLGLGICYDIRFPELSRILTLNNADILVFPGAFNYTTGPPHWKLLLRSRALDNQVYVLACSPSSDENSDYNAYGHSMIADPWGTIIAEAENEEEIVYGNLNLDKIKEIRNQIPVLKNRRIDLYNLKINEIKK